VREAFEWKAEIKFKGTAAEFNRFVDSLGEASKAGNITISIPEWALRPHHLAGCMPVPVDVLLGEDRLEPIIEGMPRMQIRYIRDIHGGIRTAHLHLGDTVVLLDRARFKTLVGQVAHELAARRVEGMEDYVDVMNQVGRLAATPIEIP
jgi:hypothetical protein